MTIKYTDLGPYAFNVEWDDNDPVESVFNGWTQIEFINALRKYAWNEMKEKNLVDPTKYDPSAINKYLKRDDFNFEKSLSEIARQLHNKND